MHDQLTFLGSIWHARRVNLEQTLTDKPIHDMPRDFQNRETTLRRAASTLSALMRAKRGVAAVEFALAAPILVGLLLPVGDLGIAFSQRIQVQQAAQAGAQYAGSHPWNTNSPTQIANAVTAAAALSGITATPAPSQVCGCPTGTMVAMAICTSTCTNGQNAGYYVVVNAQRLYKPKLPYSVLGHSLMLTAQSTVRIH